MTSHYNASGVWKTTTPYVNIGGTWKIPKSAWINLSSSWKSWFLQGGLNDIGFNTNDSKNNFNNYAASVAIQSDGKIIVSGGFTTFNGVTVNGIVRLNSDVTIDTAFTTNNGTGLDFNTYAASIAIQSDGKIILGGDFTTLNGTTVNKIVRLNSDGTRDTAFTTNTGSGANNSVRSITIQPDGKILVGGYFTTFNGVTANRIVRLNSDGTRDTAFTTNNGTGFGDIWVEQIAIQSDGKILLAGFFTTFNGVTVNRIVRLNSDGTRDTAFTTNTGSGANNLIASMAIQSDGKILLAGAFSTFNGVTVNGIVRLNSTGTRDTAFTTNTGSGVGASDIGSIGIQSDGKIILSGNFSTFNGVTANRIVRLNSDGTRDTAFTTNTGTGPDSPINSIIPMSDGKILLAGNFSTFNGVTANRIYSLNLDGTINTTFSTTNTGPGGNIAQLSSLAIQPDGKIIVVGWFTTFNGVTVNRIVRLNPDGTIDTAFTTNTGTGANQTIGAVAIQPDGKIVLSGDFTTFNGATANNIVRLNSNGTVDTAFTTNTGSGLNFSAIRIALQSDGKIVLVGIFTTFNGATVNRIVRLNSDGTRDTAFTTNTGTGAAEQVESLAIQPDGKIIVVGWFTTFNGATVNRIVRLNSNGTRDTAFTTNIGTGTSSTDRINAIQLQSDGKIVLGGPFTSFNGVLANRIVRLNSDGTRDTSFITNTGSGADSDVNALAIQSDGKIVLGGFFTTFNGTTVNSIVRLNSNGTIDTAFTTNTGVGAGFDPINSIAIQPDGKIILMGSFLGFNNTNRTNIARIGGDIAV